MIERQDNISQLEYLQRERRHTRVFSFFITTSVLGLFIVLCYYITWNSANEEEYFISDLSLAVDLGNSSIGNAALLSSPKPSLVSSASAQKFETAKTKTKFDLDENTTTSPDDVMVPFPKQNKTKDANPNISRTKPTPKRLYTGAENSNNSQKVKSLYSDDPNSSGGEKAGRKDGIAGGSSILAANGISIQGSLSNRAIRQYPTFKEKFKINSIIRVYVRVDRNGKVYFLKFGRSTTTDPNLQNLVKRKIKQLQFVSKDKPANEFGTLEFKLRVR